MDAFKQAAGFTMKWEGGSATSNHSKDPGGLTRYGISQRAYPHLNIEALTEAEALEIYYEDYWKPIQGDKLYPSLAISLFDFAFNSGVKRAITCLQTQSQIKPIIGEVDGVLGAKTLLALEKIKDFVTLTLSVNTDRILFLASLSTWPVFGRGWVRRVIDLQRELS